LVDLALEQYQKTRDIVKGLPGGAESREFKELEQIVARLEPIIEERRKDFERKTAEIMSPLFKAEGGPAKWQQIYHFALVAPPVKFVDKKDPPDLTGRGLAKACYEVFRDNAKELGDEDPDGFLYFYLDLKLRMGLVGEVINDLNPDSKKPERPGLTQIRALTAGVLGDHEAFDRHVATLEEQVDFSEVKRRRDTIDKTAFALLWSFLPETAPPFGWFGQAHLLAHADDVLYALRFQRVEWRVARGLMALESGDGYKAKKLFEEAFELAGHHAFFPGFADLTIADRYLDWLNYYQNK
jgi:hypothetical protein